MIVFLLLSIESITITSLLFFPSTVPTQRSDVPNGALLDGKHSSLAPCTCRPPVARCVTSEQLLHQPTYAFIPLCHLRGHVLSAGPTQELRVWTLTAFPWLCLHQRRGHHRLGEIAFKHCFGQPCTSSRSAKLVAGKSLNTSNQIHKKKE